MGLHWRCRAFVLNGQVSVEWSRCPGSMGRRARDSVVVWFFATKLSRLDACGNRKVVRWCRMKASSHNSQDALDGRLNEAGKHCSTREGFSTLLLNGPGLRWLFEMLLVQYPSQSQQAATRVQRMMSTFCEVTRGVGGTWVSSPTLLQGMWVSGVADGRQGGEPPPWQAKCKNWVPFNWHFDI